MNRKTMLLPLLFTALLAGCCSDPDQLAFVQGVIQNLEEMQNSCNCDTGSTVVDPEDPVVDPEFGHCFDNDGNTVALWYFDEQGGLTAHNSIMASDSVVFQKTPQRVEGTFGRAVVLESNAAAMPEADEKIFPNEITVEAYVSLDKYPSSSLSPRPHSMIVSTSDWDAVEHRGYELRITDSNGRVEFILGTKDGWVSAISSRTLELGKWYKLAGQYDGSVISVFVDGELWAKTDYTGSMIDGSVGLGIGRRVVDQPFYFFGSIDEVSISKICRYEVPTGPETWYPTDMYTIAHWTFNTVVDSTVSDITGHGHNAVLYSVPAIVAGKAGNALSFNSSYCKAPYSVDFYPEKLTVEAAVKLTSYPSSSLSPRPHMMIYSTVNWSGDYCKGYELRITDTEGKVEFIFGDDHWWHSAISEQSLPLNEWHSIAGQYDGNTISVFVDGELWAETAYESTIQQCTTDIGIARRLVDQPFYYNGLIDEIRVSGELRY